MGTPVQSVFGTRLRPRARNRKLDAFGYSHAGTSTKADPNGIFPAPRRGIELEARQAPGGHLALSSACARSRPAQGVFDDTQPRGARKISSHAERRRAPPFRCRPRPRAQRSLPLCRCSRKFTAFRRRCAWAACRRVAAQLSRSPLQHLAHVRDGRRRDQPRRRGRSRSRADR